jgi:hypothetical protein
MEDDLHLFKGRQIQFFFNETTSGKFSKLKQLKVKKIIFWIIEDELNFFFKGRRPKKNNATKNN